MKTGARTLIVGVDGLDYDLVHRLRDVAPTLFAIVEGTSPHASVFPPDSVPSWTSILSGIPPTQHQQLSNVKYFLEGADESSVNADVNHLSERCFWEFVSGDDIAVLNPFLAYPPWSPRGVGAMVSGPPFDELPPSVADPRGLLVGKPPARMGGFSKIPLQSELPAFCEETLAVGRDQWDYALAQLGSRHWDLLFITSLVIDRVEHYTWRHFESGRGALAEVIPQAHADLDRFLAEAMKLMQPDDQLILVSDHGHGPRASIGVNLHEFLRRRGLFSIVDSSAKKRMVEWTKTAVYSLAPRVGLEDAAIAMARKLPAKRALKSGSYVGRAGAHSAYVPDLAGSNPFGGISVPYGMRAHALIGELLALRYRDQDVFRWIAPKEEVLNVADPSDLYPDLLFEMNPSFGPTWNLYGPIFSPVITRKRQSGGHTRSSVYAEWPSAAVTAPAGSVEVYARIREVVSAPGPGRGLV